MRNFPILHDWRDYVIYYDGEFFTDDSDKGAIVVMNKYQIPNVYEYRHILGDSPYHTAMLFLWGRDRNGDPIELPYDFAVDDSLPGDH